MEDKMGRVNKTLFNNKYETNENDHHVFHYCLYNNSL